MTSVWQGRVVVACVVLAAGCAPAPVRATMTPRLSAVTLRVQVGEERNAVRRVALEDYVRGAVLSEFAPPGGDPGVVERMLEVQAVIARTYALANRGRHGRDGFDLCSTTHCQLYEPSRLKTSRWSAAARGAAGRTAGTVLSHRGAPIAALFHADCGGHTSTSVEAWRGTARPYLVARPDDGPAEGVHSAWRYAASLEALIRALNADPRTDIGPRLNGITVVDRDPSGRARTVALHGARERLVAGEDLRSVLAGRFGARSVRSTMFDVRRVSGTFVFTGRGFGHGVGLCQAGALARLQAGMRTRDVLRRYYPGTELTDASNPGH